MASTGVYTTLLQTAGFTPKSWSNEVLMAASNRSVTRNYVRQYAFPPGYELTIPKINVPTAEVETRNVATTDGDEGTTVGLVTIDTTGPSITPTFAHATYQVPFMSRNEVQRNAGMWLGAMKAASAQAIGVKIDATILALYSGFNGGTAIDATAGLTWDKIVEARQVLEDNNAPGPYNLFLHSKQFTAAMGIAEIKAASGLGASANFNASSVEHSGIWIPAIDLRIIFSGNVTQTGGEDKNLMFSGEGIGLAFIDELRMEEEHSVQKASDFLMTYSDFGAGELHDGYGVALETTTPV